MMPEKITFEMLPDAVMLILSEIDSMKKMISELATAPSNSERKLVDIDAAAEIIQKRRSTIYKLVAKKKIPSYKSGKKLYFFEDELIKWIMDGKTKTCASTLDEVSTMLQTNRRKRS